MSSGRRKVVRCAIYTRKSSEENLDNDFNSLDAQREACEAYAKSQVSEGWTVMAERYDDGGYSGGNMERPALKRLLSAIKGGEVDVVVIYKIDRLSRSLPDFAEMAKTFDACGVSFVSVTQRLDTSTSAGRLMLNVLLSFAQFEREIVSERTRDKIALSRKKGKWSGGRPPLGYDNNRETKRLVVNTDETAQVQAIFQLYLEHQSLLAVVQELARRGWLTKWWTTGNGQTLGGRPFDKNNLLLLLTNVVYMGKVRHKDQTYPGEHEAIVDEKTFRRVQELLKRNGRTAGTLVRNRHGALLKGLLHCACCNGSMGHSFTGKAKSRVRYRYCLCLSASKKGRKGCPAPSVPAGELDAFVIDRIRGVAADPQLIAETVRQARSQATEAIKALEAERKCLRRRNSDQAAARRSEIDQELASLRGGIVTQQEVASAFARFDELWAVLTPQEQVQIVRLLVKRIEWDGRTEQIRIIFHPTGLRGLVEQTREPREEAA